jgi:hypothetical protein
MSPPTRLDDPEDGTVEIPALQPVTNTAPSPFSTAQISSVDFNTTVGHIKSQILALAETLKPSSKTSERKVDPCLRFSLWFNTYRLVPFLLRNPDTLADLVMKENSLS